MLDAMNMTLSHTDSSSLDHLPKSLAFLLNLVSWQNVLVSAETGVQSDARINRTKVKDRLLSYFPSIKLLAFDE